MVKYLYGKVMYGEVFVWWSIV